MKHLILFVYILSFSSGIAAMVVFFYLAARNGHRLIRAYLPPLLASFVLIIILMAGYYSFINQLSLGRPGVGFIRLYTVIMLTCQGMIIYTQLPFYFTLAEKARGRFLNIVIPLAALTAIPAAAFFWLNSLNLAGVVVVILYNLLFFFLLIFSSVILLIHRRNPADPFTRRVISFILIYNGVEFLLIALEVFIQYSQISRGLYPYGLLVTPLSYLVWNALSILAALRVAENSQPRLHSDTLPAAFVSTFQLSAREQEIALQIIAGKSNKEIASLLNVSFNTARNHIYNLYQKTGVKSRFELMEKSRQY